MRKLFALIAVLGMLTIGASTMLMAQESTEPETTFYFYNTTKNTLFNKRSVETLNAALNLRINNLSLYNFPRTNTYICLLYTSRCV